MDAISEKRLDPKLLCPILINRVRVLGDTLEQEGIFIRVVQAYRSYQEQEAIYGQGRWLPGEKKTNAPPGHSYHEYGLAVDCVPGIPGMDPWQPDWQEYIAHLQPFRLKPHWARMIAVGESLGLTSGSHWVSLHDYPHFQIQGNFPVNCPPLAAQETLLKHGLEAVWKLSGLLA